ncbi:PREDICTED: uncharacterized protein LOC109165645 isoform X1 [Ipomoea nil]|uniref:uncharacterized protein LOC109165645 isoform X1 n=1 Tax=Ipomoea nil TaxID=35883 RepID=UPI000900F14D|nr:PREDICTED: uncharacterized protein LOC109165645 isoform X1 [Ipomoea nil]
MSESIAQSYQECDERTGQSMYSFQSVWIARWTGTGQNEKAQQALSSPNPLESKKINDGTRLNEDAVGVGNVSNSTESLRTSSGNIRIESSAHHSPAMSTHSRNALSSKDGQETRGFLTLKPHHDAKVASGMAMGAMNESCLGSGSMLPVVPAATAISSGKYYSEPEAALQNPAKTHLFFRNNDTAAPVPSLDNCRESASHILPYRFDYGKFKEDTSQPVMPLLMGRSSKSQVPSSGLRMLEGERNYNSHSEPGNSMNVSSSCNSHPPEFRGDWFHKLQSGSRSVVFRNNCTPFETIEPKKVLDDICMPQELPRSLHDVKTMRICTTVDSVVGLTGDYPRFSKTAHSLLIMKKADVNISKQNQTVGTSRTSNEFNNFNNLSPFLGQNQQGVKLQLLDSSTASEHEEDTGNTEPSEVEAKNESSAETDTMDMDVFPGKAHLLDSNSSPLKKAPERDQYLPQLTIGSPMALVESEGTKNRLPDMNLQFPAVPAEVTPTEQLEQSSKTQSLDMESLLAQADQPSTSKPDLSPLNLLLGPEPSSRWVKRLKLSNHDAGLALGTMSSNSKEDSSYEKYRFRGKTTQGGITSSGPMTSKNQGKDLIAQDNCAGITGNPESYSADRELLTSHSWIQRLLRNRAITMPKKPEVVVCEPQSSKLVVPPEQLEKKQFPSIAAMALMGKAMKGFQPCEFQRKGPFVVWNTNGS